MIEEIKNISNTKSDFRKFGITIGIFLLIVAGFLFWKGSETFQILLISGLVLCVFGFAVPIILKPIYWAWMTFATILGWIMTRVILSLLFYIVITPIGVLSRLFGKKFLDIKWDKSKDTYWNFRQKKERKIEDYENQF